MALTIKRKSGTKSFVDTESFLEKNFVTRNLGKLFGTAGDILAIPQRSATALFTGKYQDPSEALGLTGVSGLAADIILDPLNVLSFGAAKGMKFFSKAGVKTLTKKGTRKFMEDMAVHQDDILSIINRKGFRNLGGNIYAKPHVKSLDEASKILNFETKMSKEGLKGGSKTVVDIAESARLRTSRQWLRNGENLKGLGYLDEGGIKIGLPFMEGKTVSDGEMFKHGWNYIKNGIKKPILKTETGRQVYAGYRKARGMIAKGFRTDVGVEELPDLGNFSRNRWGQFNQGAKNFSSRARHESEALVTANKKEKEVIGQLLASGEMNTQEYQLARDALELGDALPESLPKKARGVYENILERKRVIQADRLEAGKRSLQDRVRHELTTSRKTLKEIEGIKTGGLSAKEFKITGSKKDLSRARDKFVEIKNIKLKDEQLNTFIKTVRGDNKVGSINDFGLRPIKIKSSLSEVKGLTATEIAKLHKAGIKDISKLARVNPDKLDSILKIAGKETSKIEDTRYAISRLEEMIKTSKKKKILRERARREIEKISQFNKSFAKGVKEGISKEKRANFVKRRILPIFKEKELMKGKTTDKAFIEKISDVLTDTQIKKLEKRHITKYSQLERLSEDALVDIFMEKNLVQELRKKVLNSVKEIDIHAKRSKEYQAMLNRVRKIGIVDKQTLNRAEKIGIGKEIIYSKRRSYQSMVNKAKRIEISSYKQLGLDEAGALTKDQIELVKMARKDGLIYKDPKGKIFERMPATITEHNNVYKKIGENPLFMEDVNILQALDDVENVKMRTSHDLGEWTKKNKWAVKEDTLKKQWLKEQGLFPTKQNLKETNWMDRKHIPDGWVEPKLENLKGHFMPKQFADVVDRSFAGLFNDEVSNWMWKGVKSATSWFKSWALGLYASFHIRNMEDDVVRMMVAGGMNPLSVPSRMKEAWHIFWRGARNGQWDETARIAGYSHKELYQMQKDLGVIDSGGVYFDEIEGALTKSAIATKVKGNSLKKIKNFKGIFDPSSNNLLVQKGFAIGEVLENQRRSALFLDQIYKGKSPIEASLEVKKVMFDYADLTPFERNMLRQAFPFYCVPTDSEILTKDGWKNYDELIIGEQVLTYGDKKLEWQGVKDKVVFDYDGELMSIKNNQVEFLSTFDHRWVIRDHKGDEKIVRGYKLRSSHSIPLTGKYLPNDNVLNKRESAILGWLVTDGYIRRRGGYFEAMIYQSPKKFASEIRELLGDDCTSESVHPDSGVICFRISSNSEAIKRIRKYFLSDDDLIKIATRLDIESMKSMMDAMYKADGVTYKSEAQKFFAAEKDHVRNTFQFLSQALGIPFHLNKSGGYLKKNKYLSLHNKIGTERYKGRIWCPQTPNGTWVMRRKGKIIITGNTFFKKNMELQLRILKRSPRTHATFFKLGRDKDFKREYFRSGTELPFRIPNALVGLVKEVNPDSKYYVDLSNYFSMSALDKPLRPQDTMFSMMNPFVKYAGEVTTGYDLYRNRYIYPTEVDTFFGMPISKRNPYVKALRIMRPFTEAERLYNGFAHISRETGEQFDIPDALLRAIPGLKVNEFNPKKRQEYADKLRAREYSEARTLNKKKNKLRLLNE